MRLEHGAVVQPLGDIRTVVPGLLSKFSFVEIHSTREGQLMMKKKVSTILIMLLMLSVYPAVFAATGAFHDVKDSHWAGPHIEEAVKRGYVTGYPDGTFRPGNPITRAEFASILAKATKLEEIRASQDVFADVPAGNWAKPYIDKLVSVGIIDPSDYKHRAKAGDDITRYEMVKWMVNGLAESDDSFKQALEDTKGTLVPFVEYYKGGIAEDKIPYVAVARGTQLTLGLPDGSFGFDQPTTRAEVAVIMQRYVGLEGGNADDYRELTELRDVGKTGTNMMVFDAKIGLSEDDKPLFFENIVGKEIRTKTGGSVKVHRYILVDESVDPNDKRVGVYAHLFVDPSSQRLPNSYSAFIEISYTPTVTNMDELKFLSEVDYITGYRLPDETLRQKYGFNTYPTFTKGRTEKFWVYQFIKRNTIWHNITAKDGSMAAFRFN
ncbi:S-layer homology domain-containing protein [Paenibacillaceae bacterium WGS1546]|uniref:S-layer homology domain-containing protein n=1 Tax=Cohnella sp. WGS1546 TaxID=3366810 RepID=UPI00372D27AA